MSQQHLDPNRFASGAEVASVQARADLEKAEVELAERRNEHAQNALQEARDRLAEAERVFHMQQDEFNAASTYAESARELLDASIVRLGVVRAPLHPIRKTPIEVLSLIFELCVQRDTMAPAKLAELPTSSFVARQRQPFHLAGTCRLWRRAALATPLLWTDIKLRLDDATPKTLETWQTYLSTMLSRSSSAPLHIYISRCRVPQRMDESLIQSVVAAIKRCESLCIYVPTVKNNNDKTLLLMSAEMPALRELTLHAGIAFELDDHVEILPHTPLLATITATFPFSLCKYNFPAVTAATLQTCTHDSIAEFLTLAPAASVIYLESLHREEEPQVITEAPNVKTLTVCRNKVDNELFWLARRFSFPELRKLILRGARSASRGRLSYLQGIVGTATAVALGNLILHNIDFDVSIVETLAEVLADLPNLKRLEFRGISFTQHAFKRFCDVLGAPGDEHGMWTCPALLRL
ncbi:hypothetical protein EXIGLDRAFT_770276, partial [Exidia glandulosa HHB12029]